MKTLIALSAFIIVGQFNLFAAEAKEIHECCYAKEEVKTSEVKKESKDEKFLRMEARSMSLRSGRH